METIFANPENSKMNDPHEFFSSLATNIRYKKWEKTCCSSKRTYLLHNTKYKKTV